MNRLLLHFAWMAPFFLCQLFASEPLTREQKVRLDREKVEAAGFWIYNDLGKAYDLAKQSGKPILVSMRYIPCEECVKLDDDLVDNDPAIHALLQQFVCVRVVGTNGLDLDTFQYDTDQSFAMFMLNVDGTIYGRFGTRSHRTDWLGDVSLKGMAQRAGFRVDDILIQYDGQTDLMREADLFAYANEHLRLGDKVPIKLIREGKTQTLLLPIQE